MDEFTGKVAVVTGGAGGIGSATATLLAEKGATVVVADLDPAPVSGWPRRSPPRPRVPRTTGTWTSPTATRSPPWPMISSPTRPASTS